MEEVEGTRAKQNEVLNAITREGIDSLIKCLCTNKYKQKKGKKRARGLDYAVPYLVSKDEEIFCNPMALSENLNKKQKQKLERGYFTIPVKQTYVPSLQAPPSTSTKSTWFPRVGVHGIVWRYQNNYKLVPEGCDVSHLSNQKGRLTRGSLCVENGVLNRSRSACFQEEWYKEPKGDGVRCPHSPVCQEPVKEPSAGEYESGDCKVIGLDVL